MFETYIFLFFMALALVLSLFPLQPINNEVKIYAKFSLKIKS